MKMPLGAIANFTASLRSSAVTRLSSKAKQDNADSDGHNHNGRKGQYARDVGTVTATPTKHLLCTTVLLLVDPLELPTSTSWMSWRLGGNEDGLRSAVLHERGYVPKSDKHKDYSTRCCNKRATRLQATHRLKLWPPRKQIFLRAAPAFLLD